MFLTFLSILIAAALTFLKPTALNIDASHLTLIVLLGSTCLFLATILLNLFVLIPLQSLEQKLIPNLMELVQHNRHLRIGRVALFAFTLLSYVSVIFLPLQKPLHQNWFLIAWIVFFGMAFDIFRYSWRHFVYLLNPTDLVTQFSSDALKAIRGDQKNVLLNQLDSLAEVAFRSVEKSKLALSTQTLQTFPSILRTFFDSSKSISHASQDVPNAQGTNHGDEANFLVFYLLQRFELINDKALSERQETTCRQMIMTLGKIIVHCAQYDLSMVSFPTHFLTKFGLKAQQVHFDEVAELTTSTLLEIAKTILTEIDVTYAELEEPFKAIINGLDVIAQATFKKRKNMSIKVLVQPLVDLKTFFTTQKMINHRDTLTIIREIDRVLEEFNILQQVMQVIPSVSDLNTPEVSP